MADRTWKAFERRLARSFGTERIPAAGVLGSAQREAPDFETDALCFQVKKGYSPPSYLRAWLDGIVGQAASKGKSGVVVWGAKRCRDDDALVFMRLADFRSMALAADAHRLNHPHATGD